MSREEKNSKTFDVITGFVMLDSKYHIFVLEGIKCDGLRALYERMPRARNTSDSANDQLQVLYNTDMSFSERLYTKLELDLLKVKLFEPIDEIVKKPLLYVRDMTPKPSYEALMKIHNVSS